MANYHPNTSGLRPPWQPGQPGNPNGGSRKASRKAIARKFIDENDLWMTALKVYSLKGIGETDKLKAKKLSPDIAAMKFVWDMAGIAADQRRGKGQEIQSKNVEPIDPDEAAFLAVEIAKARQRYADSRTDVRPGDQQGGPDEPEVGQAGDIG